MVPAGGVVRGDRVRARLRPSRVSGHGAALLRRLEVRQRRDHRGDPGGCHVHRWSGRRRGVMEETGLVRRGSVVCGHRYTLIHVHRWSSAPIIPLVRVGCEYRSIGADLYATLRWPRAFSASPRFTEDRRGWWGWKVSLKSLPALLPVSLRLH